MLKARRRSHSTLLAGIHLPHLAAVVQVLQRSDVTSLDVVQPTGTLKIRMACRDSRANEESAPEVAAPMLEVSRQLRSPGIGRVYWRHPMVDAPKPLVPGPVRAGTAIAFLRVGEAIHPVVCAQTIHLLRCLHDDGTIVGFGEVLCDYC